MGWLLRELREYTPALFPVRGVCVDSDTSEQPQDIVIDPASIQPGLTAETDPPAMPFNVATMSDVGKRGYDRQSSLFEFFLDGTRRTFLVAEMESSSKRYLPVLGGQISAAVVRRDRATGKVQVHRHRGMNIIALPGGGYGINDGDLRELDEKLQKAKRPFHVVPYGERGISKKEQPAELAIAAINAAMQKLEIEALEDLTNSNLTSSGSMLIVDGSVQFTRIPLKHQSWLRNVIGVSKTFRTNLVFTKNKEEIGAVIVKTLRNAGDRTPAFKATLGGNMYAAWYLRIRDWHHTDKPLSGVVKVERLLLTEEEMELGLSTDSVNNVSLSLLGERYVTPYGKDERWANHLYPVYLAERYQKSQLMSEMQFLRLF